MDRCQCAGSRGAPQPHWGVGLRQVHLLDEEGDDDAAGLRSSRAIFAWLDKGLSKEDQEHIEARLRDEDDDLDFDTLGDIIQKLMERVSGRPTT